MFSFNAEVPLLIQDVLLPGLKTISSEATMVEAQKILKELNIRHLPVIKDRKIVGMLSEKDVNRAMTMILASDNKHETHIQDYKMVSDFMSYPVMTMKQSESVEKLTREMVSLKVSSIIIEDEQGYPVGIMTTEDLLILFLDTIQSQTSPMVKFRRILSRFGF